MSDLVGNPEDKISHDSFHSALVSFTGTDLAVSDKILTWFASDLGGNPEDKISHAEAYFTQPLSPLHQSLDFLCVSDTDLAV